MGMLLRRYHADVSNIKADGVTTKEMVAPKPAHSAPKAEGKKEKEADKPVITAEEIDAMNGTKLRKFAKDQGIDKPEDLTVGELRAVLHEQFG